jgi:quercetin dioxygenase-like cupin family protein
MKRRNTIVMAGVAALIAVTAAAAWATPSIGFVGTNVSVGRFQEMDVKTKDESGHSVKLKTQGESDVYVVSNTFAPGGESGWHTHPGPSLITVKSGTITAYEDDCTSVVYEAGEGFVDPGDGHRHNLRNETTSEAVTLAVQILPAGAPRRIDAPAPDC